MISEEKTAIGFWFKIKALFKYGVTDWSIYKQDISKRITTFQAMYYRAKQAELSAKIADIEKYLNSIGFNINNDMFKNNSLYFRNALVRSNYGNIPKGIYPTFQYLAMFFENLLQGKEHELKNRELYVKELFEEE